MSSKNVYFAKGVNVFRKKCKMQSDSFITGYNDFAAGYYYLDLSTVTYIRNSVVPRWPEDSEYMRGFDEAWYDLTQK